MVGRGLEEAISQVERIWAMLPAQSAADTPLSDPVAESDALTRARLYLSRGDAVRARQAAQEAVGSWIRQGEPRPIRGALAVDASALLLQGHYNVAEHVVAQIEASVDPGEPSDNAMALEMRGWWGNRVGRHGSGHYELARHRFSQAAQLYRTLEDWEGTVRCLEGRAGAEGGIGDYPRALQTIEEAIAISRSNGVPSRIHRLALETAMIGKDSGYERFALDVFPGLIARCRAAGDAASQARALLGHASVLAHRAPTHADRANAAQEILRQVIEFGRPLGLFATVLEARIALIDVLRRTGEIEAEGAEREKMEETLDQLPAAFALQLYYREKEQQSLYRNRLIRQVSRLKSTLDTSEDAILIFDPRSAPNGGFADFFCELGNAAAMAMLQPQGLGVLILSELARQPILQGIEPMVRTCCITGSAQNDEIMIPIAGEERYYSRRVLPVPPGAAVCLRDVSAQTRWTREVEETMNRTVLESVRLEIEHKELLETNRRLGRLATTDGLTGLLNHRTFQERLDEELQRARRLETDLSLIMIDLDRFKRLNDDHGHQAGDRVLRDVADALVAAARAYDSVARYGGEEFAVILPSANREDAVAVAERMRVAISGLFSERFCVTASFGVASVGADTPSQEILIDRADQALYASKRAGRNRVTHAADLEQ